ncbi:leucine-rich repeat protein [Anaeromassilibacillus senegalensis]|uniref:leucine-rich repeat protein n=1 Tax=Anaeromassilibacillus senegalensis TaxID=1673717 RepID=UPI0006836C21|nr:leucine-rich repeat protein [Anaeromassilibacillus senegalensis]
MSNNTTRAAGPGGVGGVDGDAYPLAYTGAEIDTAISGWQTAKSQADATAADIAAGKKAITTAGLVTGTMQASGGDSGIADAIINRSVENINSIAENVGESAFYGCEKLATARFSVALNVGKSAFRQCVALAEIDFHEAQEISEYAFYGCKVCNIFIFRSKSLCKLVNSNAFTNTPIRSSGGYIYVPSDLLDRYKSATNWGTFSSKFRAIEDYPEICGGTT